MDLNISTIEGPQGPGSEIDRKWFCYFLTKTIFRVFWFVAFLIATYFLCWLMFQVTETFVSDNIVIEFSNTELSVGEVPFPAITICPEVFHKDLLEMFDEEIAFFLQNASHK